MKKTHNHKNYIKFLFDVNIFIQKVLKQTDFPTFIGKIFIINNNSMFE
jgi:hypothetical protein